MPPRKLMIDSSELAALSAYVLATFMHGFTDQEKWHDSQYHMELIDTQSTDSTVFLTYVAHRADDRDVPGRKFQVRISVHDMGEA